MLQEAEIGIWAERQLMRWRRTVFGAVFGIFVIDVEPESSLVWPKVTFKAEATPVFFFFFSSP